MTALTDLPSDLLRTVVMHVDAVDDVISLSCTCREAAAVIGTAPLMVRQHEEGSSDDALELQTAWLTKHAPRRVVSVVVKRFRGERLVRALDQIRRQDVKKEGLVDVNASSQYLAEEEQGKSWEIGASSPLEMAAERDEFEAVDRLLEFGGDVRQQRAMDRAAYSAAEAGHVRTLRVLLRHGADPRYLHPLWSMNALHVACFAGALGCVGVLLDDDSCCRCRHEHINQKEDIYGMTPLMHAIVAGNARCAQRLAEDDRVDVNARADTHYLGMPLTAAVRLRRGDALIGTLSRRGARE